MKIKDIEQIINDLDFDSLLEALAQLNQVTDATTASGIFEKQLEHYKDDFSACTDILALYIEQNRQACYKYLPYLNYIIFKSTEKDYSLVAMAYIMKKSDNDDEWIAYDESGDIYSLEEGMEAVKIKAAVIYYLADRHNWEVTSFLKNMLESSRFENHKSYIKSKLQGLL
jgi:hypothetical protein